mgnify:CR=1 FL=1
MPRPRTVCYLGAYDPDYPRNQILRLGLAAHGVNVVECRVSKTLPTLRKLPALIRQYATVYRQCDCVVLAEFGQSLALPVWLLTRLTRRPLLTDLLISYYDMAVAVRRDTRPGTLAAYRYWWLDAIAVRYTRAALVDAEPHRQHFIQTFGGDPRFIHVLPLGVNNAHFTPRGAPPHDGTLVQYVGSYTPAHGVLTLLRAAHQLQHRPDLRFEFIGTGQDRPAAEDYAHQHALTNVTFRDPVPYADLPDHIARADLCLGEFGDTPQTRRGLANKVYQTLAMRKPLLAGDTESLRSLFTPGQHLHTTPLADAPALAAAIAHYADHPAEAAALATAGHAHVSANFTPGPLAARLLAIAETLPQ